MDEVVQEAHSRSNHGECVSRIFEALNRVEEGYEDLLPVLREQAVEAAHVPADGRNQTVADDEGQPSTQPAPSLPVGFQAKRIVDLRIPRSLPVLPFDGVNDIASEEYRKIRTRILHHPSRPKMFLVSSPCSGDGKTITALNLGGALALKESADVLVIDADFAHGTMKTITGVPNSPGLGEVLTGKASLEDAVVRTSQFPRLHLLTAGVSDVNPAELLDSDVWLRLLEKLRRCFAYVVVDSPPVEAVPFYARLLDACDGMVLVARPDHTERAALNDALRGVPKSKLIGVVLNCNPKWFLYGKNHERYGYYSGARESNR
jgi:protein-tyrosine kinase